MYYTYYSYEEYGRGYIGSRTCSCLPEDDVYFGSYVDKSFNPTHKVVLGVYDTIEAALEDEVILHEYYNVDKNPHFANQSKQRSVGFHMDWTGRKHKQEFFEKKKGKSFISEEGRQRIRESNKKRKRSAESRQKTSQSVKRARSSSK
tara:strand:+ start:11605 stop:12045 length:441 start_codon:yes stop_codon:yes gene_type:complete